MDVNTNILAKQIGDLARTLAELDGTPKAKIQAVFETMYVPAVPQQKGVVGGAPLDGQLDRTASDAMHAARECDEAASIYDRVAEDAAAVMRSPILKAVAAWAEAGKARAAERRAECVKVADLNRRELERRQEARAEALAELEKAKEAAREVERIKMELAAMRATFA